MQSIALESFDGKYSDSESDEVNNVIANIKNEADSSDSNDKYTDQEAPTDTDAGARPRSSSDNDEQTLYGKYGSHGRRSVPSQVTAGRLQQHNIVGIHAGSISHSTSRIIHSSPLYSFRILFNKPMLRNIQKRTAA